MVFDPNNPNAPSECERQLNYGDGKRNAWLDRKSTRLNSSHLGISYAVFCLKKKTAHVGILDEHDIAELLLRVKGDADGRGHVRLHLTPLVALAVFQQWVRATR